MKTIIILTDAADGSVNIEYMTQSTTEEIARGLQPMQSPAYQCAITFNAVVNNAKALTAEMRAMHADRAEAELAQCLH